MSVPPPTNPPKLVIGGQYLLVTENMVNPVTITVRCLAAGGLVEVTHHKDFGDDAWHKIESVERMEDGCVWKLAANQSLHEITRDKIC